MENIIQDIFDANGNPIDVTQVVAAYIREQAASHNMDPDDDHFFVGVDGKYLTNYTLSDNGYNGYCLDELQSILINSQNQ